MMERGVRSFIAAPAGLALAAALALASVVASGENGLDVRPAVMVGDDLLRVFQEGKDAAEQADPPEITLGPAFHPPPHSPRPPSPCRLPPRTWPGSSPATSASATAPPIFPPRSARA